MNRPAKIPSIDQDGTFIAVVMANSKPQYQIGYAMADGKLMPLASISHEQAQSAIDHPRYFRALLQESMAMDQIDQKST